MTYFVNTIIIAIFLVVGLYLRFDEWHYLNKMFYLMLFFPVLVLFIIHFRKYLKTKNLKKNKTYIIYLTGLVTLFLFTFESETANRKKQIKFLQRHIKIVQNYIEKHGEAPEHFDTALSSSGKTIPNRGDADGNGLIYKKTDSKDFMFITFGSNNIFDDGLGDDVVVRGSK